MPATISPAEQRVVLRNVSWETYLRILADHVDASSPRFTFDRGDLEIISPSAEHERYNLRIADFLGVLCEDLNIDTEALGSTTFKREEPERGFETDSCFYVKNSERVRHKKEIDLAVDPPPDLVIEIEITSPAINKLGLYAEFGVPERRRAVSHFPAGSWPVSVCGRECGLPRPFGDRVDAIARTRKGIEKNRLAEAGSGVGAG
jgi:Uma2 family endonuclease